MLYKKIQDLSAEYNDICIRQFFSEGTLGSIMWYEKRAVKRRVVDYLSYIFIWEIMNNIIIIILK